MCISLHQNTVRHQNDKGNVNNCTQRELSLWSILFGKGAEKAISGELCVVFHLHWDSWVPVERTRAGRKWLISSRCKPGTTPSGLTR